MLAIPLRYPRYYVLGSDQTTASTSLIDVPGFAHPMLANRAYSFVGFLEINSDTAAGMRIGLNGPGTATRISLHYNGTTSSLTTTLSGQITSYAGSAIFGTSAADGIIQISGGFVVNGSTAGILTLQFTKQTSGNAKIYAGSWWWVMEQ